MPAAAEVVLESDEDELAAAEEMLASYDALAVDDDVAAECNEFQGPAASEHLPAEINDKLAAEDEAMLVSYKDTPAGKQVELDNLSALDSLWNLQDGCVVLLASVFGPACRIFTYRKVRKKKYHRKTTTH